MCRENCKISGWIKGEECSRGDSGGASNGPNDPTSLRPRPAVYEVCFTVTDFGPRDGVARALAICNGCRSGASTNFGVIGDVLRFIDCFDCTDALRIDGDMVLGGVFSLRMRCGLSERDGEEMHDPAEEIVRGERW